MTAQFSVYPNSVNRIGGIFDVDLEVNISLQINGADGQPMVLEIQDPDDPDSITRAELVWRFSGNHGEKLEFQNEVDGDFAITDGANGRVAIRIHSGVLGYDSNFYYHVLRGKMPGETSWKELASGRIDLVGEVAVPRVAYRY